MRIQARAVMVGGTMAFCLSGCAHHQANQYAYAPPLAPPAYPQPQAASPMVAAVPATAPAPVVAPEAAVVAAAAPVTPQAVAGSTMAIDPCCEPLAAGGVPVVYESGDQTPACPPGP